MKNKNLTMLIVTIIFLIIVVTIQHSYVLKYFYEPENPIINPPVTTVNILSEVSKVPVNNMFDPPYVYNSNSGIIKHPHQKGYLLAHQTDIGPSTKYYRTKLHIFALDENFIATAHNEIHNHEFYTFNKRHWSGLSTAQDPRLFTANEKIYMLYNDAVNVNHREVYIADISIEKNIMFASNIVNLYYADGAYRDQKNWTPFVYKTEIYFICTSDPHLILHWDPKSNIVTEAYNNGKSFGRYWPLGSISGGTPAVYVKELDAYLTFFHSFLPYRQREPKITQIHQPYSRIYYVGAFLFESKPPFKIIAYTPQPLSFPGFYKRLDVNYHILFPNGLIEEQDTFLISAGIQDTKAEILRVNKTELYKQFKYIEDKDAKHVN